MESNIYVEFGPYEKKKLIYKAELVDFNVNEAMVQFSTKNPQQEFAVPFSMVRFPPAFDENEQKPGEGEDAEVMVTENGHQAWRRATVQKVKGEYVTVCFTDEDESSCLESTIVNLQDIRFINLAPAISADLFTKFELIIPREFDEVSKEPGAHVLFLTHIKARVCKYLSEKSILRVISMNSESVKLGAVLLNLHLHDLAQRVAMEKALKQRKELLYTRTCQRVEEEFEVPRDLMGHVIGKCGRNIVWARAMPGIIDVKCDNVTKVTIIGENEEVVRKVRKMLEYKYEFFYLPKYVSSEILNTTTMEEIIFKNNLVNIYSGKKHMPPVDCIIPSKQGFVTLLIAGLPDSIAPAVLQLEYLCNTFKDMYKIRQQLHSMSVSTHDLTQQREDGEPEGNSESDPGEDVQVVNLNKTHDNNEKEEKMEERAPPPVTTPRPLRGTHGSARFSHGRPQIGRGRANEIP